MIRIRDIKVNIDDNLSDVLKRKYNVKKYNIIKESIDARKGIVFVYTVDIEVDNEELFLKKYKSEKIFITPKEEYIFNITGTNKIKSRPIIVGLGPAGLFLGYMLSKYGYKPLIIERGERIEDRVKTVEEFWKNNKININSNVQFGEGGAGTFSDGKLNTLVKDKIFRGKKVFEIFVECGAPKEIMYSYKPHIGTDILRDVVINMRNKIISYGGEIRYNTKLTNIIIDNNSVSSIEVNDNEKIECNYLFLALGHSARDTFKMLNEVGINMKSKPFAVGLRIEHRQEDINKSLYKNNYNKLGPASYKLTYNTKDNRGVYSFCMCPGGYVVNASSEKNRLVINGMSNYKRDSKIANSALVVSVSSKDYGDDLFDGMHFQEKLEEDAYKIGNGLIPCQTLIDFNNNKKTECFNLEPLTKGSYISSNLNDVLPKYITESIKEAIPSFKKQIDCFDKDDSVLLGIESRTSSPITIIRDEFGESNIKGIYPVGEGAGYSGGITTSAMDALKQVENFSKRYMP